MARPTGGGGEGRYAGGEGVGAQSKICSFLLLKALLLLLLLQVPANGAQVHGGQQALWHGSGQWLCLDSLGDDLTPIYGIACETSLILTNEAVVETIIQPVLLSLLLS